MAHAADSGLDVSVSPWHDLVYNALSHLPVPAADASSLFDESYVRWSETRLGGAGLRSGAVPRTLMLDAPLLAALYSASRQGFLLHAWPLLWDDAEAFLRDAGTAFEALTWPTQHRAALAMAIRENVEPPLPELLRTALWSELANCYEAAWRRVVAPRSQACLPEFARLLGEVAARLPELRGFRWVLCHPLRWHGRLLERPGAPPLIAVGVADPELGVPPTHPIVQGCHECFVHRARAAAPAGERWATIPGRPGHEAFDAVETAALGLGARFFVGSSWEGPYLDWLRRFFPGEPPEEAAARLTAGT